MRGRRQILSCRVASGFFSKCVILWLKLTGNRRVLFITKAIKYQPKKLAALLDIYQYNLCYWLIWFNYSVLYKKWIDIFMGCWISYLHSFGTWSPQNTSIQNTQNWDTNFNMWWSCIPFRYLTSVLVYLFISRWIAFKLAWITRTVDKKSLFYRKLLVSSSGISSRT